MTELIDLTLTLGSERVSAVPGLIGVTMKPLHTHESHTRSNTKLTLATHLGTHPRVWKVQVFHSFLLLA